METMNVIIEIHGGIIESVITCKCSTQAGLLYVGKARQMGVSLDDDEVNDMSCSDMALSIIIDKVDLLLGLREKELKWFESDHYKSIK